jgi:hypothetical protein
MLLVKTILNVRNDEFPELWNIFYKHLNHTIQITLVGVFIF